MKNILLAIFISVLCGCVSIVPEQSYPLQQVNKDRQPLTNIYKVMIGMSLKEVEDIMGTETVVGYQQKADDPSAYEAIIFKNPYREESLELKDKTYRVLYYLTDIKKVDGFVAEDELTPLIFDGENLIGKGQDHLFRLKNSL